MVEHAVQPDLLRVSEAATILGLSRSKLYMMMDSGELPYVKFGKSRRVQRSELASLIQRNTVPQVGAEGAHG